MPKPAMSPTTIPQHVFERLENEWRQMQMSHDPAPKPPAQSAQPARG